MTEVVHDILLSPAERDRRNELEGVIERGLRSFVEVGQALTEINASTLYRDTHNTFEAYCDERWGFARRYAYYLIDAAEVCTIVHTAEAPTPATESVARELAPLRKEPEKLRQAWQEAIEVSNGSPTARDVKAVVEQYRPPSSNGRPAAAPTYCPMCGHRVPADRPLRPREEIA
jgi:hypothetical protein